MNRKKKEKLISKNRHKMAARHHKDESINKEKKNSNEKHVDKILEEIDLTLTFINRATSESSGFNNKCQMYSVKTVTILVMSKIAS